MPERRTTRRGAICRESSDPTIRQDSPDRRKLTERSRGANPTGTAARLHFPVVGPGVAFFDLDKTVIAKSSALAFGRPFFRDGLITRRDVIKAAYAQLLFRLGGADEQQMARIRDYVAGLRSEERRVGKEGRYRWARCG